MPTTLEFSLIIILSCVLSIIVVGGAFFNARSLMQKGKATAAQADELAKRAGAMYESARNMNAEGMAKLQATSKWCDEQKARLEDVARARSLGWVNVYPGGYSSIWATRASAASAAATGNDVTNGLCIPEELRRTVEVFELVQ